MARPRADAVLVARGLFSSRERARAAILAGDVRIGGVAVRKAGEQVDPDAEFEIVERAGYVSRGGAKLDRALSVFGVDPSGLRCLDVGASTGGFTDRLLRGGASGVTAVDVGYGQLAWSLRNDPRVRVRERTSIRDADPVALGAPFDLAAVDVSFIGLGKVLPAVFGMMAEGGVVLALVKPQFEIGKGRVGRRGVVRDAADHVEVLGSVMAAVAESGWVVRGLTWSPVKGPEGNIEFWVMAAAYGEPASDDAASVVREAHRELE